MNRVIVKIAGIEYPIAGDETKEYLESLGGLVNEEVEKVTQNSNGINLTMATTLAAINIADKLLKNKTINKIQTQTSSQTNNNTEIINRMEFKIQEKDVQIEALTSKLSTAEKSNIDIDDTEKIKEIMAISNEFQNRIFELQQEVELLKKQLEKVEV